MKQKRSDLGCHVGGHIAVVAHTLQVRAAGAAGPVTGRAADVLAAAAHASEALLRLVRPGRRSSEVAPYLARIAEGYKCKCAPRKATMMRTFR